MRSTTTRCRTLLIIPRTAGVSSRSTPIALTNLLRYLADIGQHELAAGQTYDVGGPDTLTYAEIMRRYGALVGKRPIIIPVPVLTPRLSSYWLRLVTSVPTNVARALIDGLSQDVVADDDRLAKLIPQQLLGFDAAAAESLEADRQHAIPVRWVESAIACDEFRPEYSFYAKQAEGSAVGEASTSDLWNVVCQFGHEGEFFYGRPLWWLRRALDWTIGGPSLRRRRRDPAHLRVGDVVDAWRVIAVDSETRLTLLMEMKSPGAGVLEFTIVDEGAHRRISMHAYWHPAGVWGLLYWYALLPVHVLLFKNTAHGDARVVHQRLRRPVLQDQLTHLAADRWCRHIKLLDVDGGRPASTFCVERYRHARASRRLDPGGGRQGPAPPRRGRAGRARAIRGDRHPARRARRPAPSRWSGSPAVRCRRSS